MIVIRIVRFPGGGCVWLDRREAARLGLKANLLSRKKHPDKNAAIRLLIRKVFPKRQSGDIFVSDAVFPKKICVLLLLPNRTAAPQTFYFTDEAALFDAVLRFSGEESDILKSGLYLLPDGCCLVLFPKKRASLRCLRHFGEYAAVLPPFALLEGFLAEYAVLCEESDALGLLRSQFFR